MVAAGLVGPGTIVCHGSSSGDSTVRAVDLFEWAAPSGLANSATTTVIVARDSLHGNYAIVGNRGAAHSGTAVQRGARREPGVRGPALPARRCAVGPGPAHRIGIWLGVYGPLALGLAARLADGWVPSLTGDAAAVREMARRLDDAAAAVGRDPAAVRRILNVRGVITDGSSSGVLQGPVDQWVDELTDLVVATGFDTFVLWTEGTTRWPASPTRSSPPCGTGSRPSGGRPADPSGGSRRCRGPPLRPTQRHQARQEPRG
ncbi:MAG: LLM class flavin-dependent oxidoreductase [Acidimicrobiales bacterium]